MEEHVLAKWVGKPISAYIAEGHEPVTPGHGHPEPVLENDERVFYFRYNPHDPRYPENHGPQTDDDDITPKPDRYVILTQKRGDSGTLADYIITGYGAPKVIYY